MAALLSVSAEKFASQHFSPSTAYFKWGHVNRNFSELLEIYLIKIVHFVTESTLVQYS